MSGRRPALPGVQKDVDALLGDEPAIDPAAVAPAGREPSPAAATEAASTTPRTNGAHRDPPGDIDRAALMELASQYPSAGAPVRAADPIPGPADVPAAAPEPPAVAGAQVLPPARIEAAQERASHRESDAGSPAGHRPAAHRDGRRDWLPVAGVAMITIAIALLAWPLLDRPPPPAPAPPSPVAASDGAELRATRLALLALRIERLAEAGRPFAAELADMRATAAPSSALAPVAAALDGLAAAATPTARDLGLRLSAQAPQVAAIPVPASAAASGGWFGGLFSSQPSPEALAVAVLARARADIDGGDLAAAVGHVRRLPIPQRDALQPWIAAAERRIALDAGTREITAIVFDAMAKGR